MLIPRLHLFEFEDQSWFPTVIHDVILPVVFTPLFVALATPFIRPFRWGRLFWTYVVPLVPLTCLWDGLVSQLRAYTVGELDRLTQDLAHDSYQWRTGQVPIPPTHGHVTYLFGYRRNLDRGGQLLIREIEAVSSRA